MNIKRNYLQIYHTNFVNIKLTYVHILLKIQHIDGKFNLSKNIEFLNNISKIRLWQVIYVDSFFCYTSQIIGTLAQLNLVHVLAGD